MADGTVAFCGYSYHQDFLTVYGDSDYEKLVADVRRKDPEAVRWVGYGLRLGSGLVVWYTGLRAPAVREFKTGEQISRGELLGLSAYSDRTVAEPSIGISCDLGHRRADPSVWLTGASGPAAHPAASTARNYRILEHSAADLKAYLRVALEALEEGHPALYAYIDPGALRKAFTEAAERIDRPMTSDQFLP